MQGLFYRPTVEIINLFFLQTNVCRKLKCFWYIYNIPYLQILITLLNPITTFIFLFGSITQMAETTTQVIMKTYRYEFSELAMMQLNYFTQVHRYDERKAFKEAWKKWIETEEIAEMIRTETERLARDGFKGDVEDKMFKAVRYYFRKKPTDTENPTKQPRKKYVGFTGELLTAMDEHIISRIRENLYKIKDSTTEKIQYKSNVSPEKAFADFHNTNQELVRKEIQQITEYEECETNAEKMTLKIKKTYKNRYQTIRKKLSELCK